MSSTNEFVCNLFFSFTNYNICISVDYKYEKLKTFNSLFYNTQKQAYLYCGKPKNISFISGNFGNCMSQKVQHMYIQLIT